MDLEKLRSPEWRARAATVILKKTFAFTRRAPSKTPLLIAGFQRSGTTMLMNILHLRGDTEVFDEARESKTFEKFRIRSIEIVRQAIDSSHYPFPCFKVIADSHVMPSILRELPDALVIWMYREPGPNAASRLKMFRRPTAAIRAVCEGQPGGGWFAEGVPATIARELQGLDRSKFTDWDFACLAWWVRNRIYFDLGLVDERRVRLLRYETLVAAPVPTMRALNEWVGMEWRPASTRFVHSASMRKPDLPALDPQVASRCDELLQRLDAAHAAQWQVGVRSGLPDLAGTASSPPQPMPPSPVSPVSLT
jgi:hypothetical protein